MASHKLPRSFFFNVDLFAPNGCWVWTGCRNGTGYGSTTANGTSLAHRAMFIAAYGDIPNGMCVCHTCDNPSCVNPHHLFLGTRSDNMQDMLRKGRGKYSTYTHCPQGHEYTPENTWWHSDTKGGKKRVCRACKSAKNRAYLDAHPHVPIVRPDRACVNCQGSIPADKDMRAMYCSANCKAAWYRKTHRFPRYDRAGAK